MCKYIYVGSKWVCYAPNKLGERNFGSFVSLLVSSGEKQIILWARWCWGPDILTECIFFFCLWAGSCLWASSNLVPWTDSPFGLAVSIAHLLIQLQGWSTGELRLTSPFQIHTKPAGQEFPLEHKDGSVMCWGVGTGWWHLFCSVYLPFTVLILKIFMLSSWNSSFYIPVKISKLFYSLKFITLIQYVIYSH